MIGFGQGALLSGLESFVLSPTDCRRLDSTLAAMGRIAMMGAATCWTGPHPTSLSNVAVLAHWKLLGCEMEMKIRRLRMYQSWALDPQHHCQVLCCLFGVAAFDRDRPPLENGQPTSYASPWVLQLYKDFVWAAGELEVGILDDIVADLTVLGDRDRAEDLQAVDFFPNFVHVIFRFVWHLQVGPPRRRRFRGPLLKRRRRSSVAG